MEIKEPEEDRNLIIKEGLKHYDIIVDVNSLKKMRGGWKIYGKHQKDFDVYTRLVSFVGEFKSGKTWIIKKLLTILVPNRDEIPLPDNAVLATPGLCMILPIGGATDRQKSPDEIRFDVLSQKKASGKVLVRKEKQEFNELEKKLKNQAPNNASVVHGLSFLDTQGTNTACQETELNDVRATEHLLRTLIVQLATRVVYVVKSFTRQSQIQINALIRQIEKSGNPINQYNRLYVIHNLRDIGERVTLNKIIEEVRLIYDHQNDEDSTQSSQLPWLEIPVGDIFLL